MTLTLIAVFAQLASFGPPPTRPVAPVLAFPDRELDDRAAYRGYVTRFFRDGAGNTLQIYLDNRSGRVVHLWADGENESIGFTARAGGRPTIVRWANDSASVSLATTSTRARALEYRLVVRTAKDRLRERSHGQGTATGAASVGVGALAPMP